MSSIATLKSIRSLEQDNFYRPLLDVNNSDNCGQYAYVWQNPVYQGKLIRNEEWNRKFVVHSSFVSYVHINAEYTS